MHSNRSINIQDLMNQIQPKPHKVLKKSLKITLKSNDNKYNKNISIDKYANQISHRLSRSVVGQNGQNGQIQKNKLKKDIDSRLNKVYSVLVKHSSIQLTSSKLNLKNNQRQTLPLKNQIKCSPFQIINEKNPQIYQQLPYELLKKYIENIYQEYHIQDPLQLKQQVSKNNSQLNSQTQTPLKSYKVDEYKLSTKKKIVNLKNNFVTQLNFNNTTKRKQKLKLSTPQKLITQSSFDSGKLQFHNQSKGIGLSTKKKLEQTLKSMQRLNEEQGQITYESVGIHTKGDNKRNQTLADTKLTLSQVNYMTLNSVHYRLNDSLSVAGNEQKRKIPQLFRYCFVCQQPILQANMSFHQRQCQGLTKILNDKNLTQEMLHQIIDCKIKKLQQYIEEIFIKNQQNETLSKLTQIKDKVKGWLNSISSQMSSGMHSQKRKSISQYSDINNLIKSTKLMESIEAINKLNWFNHLKKNFQVSLKRSKNGDN